MKLSKLFQNLALGELSGSPYVDLGGYEFSQDKLPKIINAINQGLTLIYSEFPLKQNQVTIQRVEGISRYYLDSTYASTSNSENIKYILDTFENPFKDDVLHILNVTDLAGSEIPLNDMLYDSIQTPEYNCIHVRDGIRANQLVVHYQANHEMIPLTEPLNSSFKINLPFSYFGALQAYVASIVYMNMSGEKHISESNHYYAKYRTIVDTIKLQGIGEITQSGINKKPEMRGWK